MAERGAEAGRPAAIPESLGPGGETPAAEMAPAADRPLALPVAGPAQPRVSPASQLLRVLRPVVSAGTWLAVIHLMAGAVLGGIVFALILVMTFVGIATLWFFLLGLPVLAAMLGLCVRFARAERARFAVLLDAYLPAPPVDLSPGAGSWRRIRRILGTQATRRQVLYALIRLPLGLAEAAATVVMWSFALAMLGLPFFGWLQLRAWHVAGTVPSTPVEMAAVSALGLILLLAAPHLTRGLAVADTLIARYLIGPGDAADMTVRIGELERSRARVVDAAEAERRRIERDLHDGAQQRLVSLAMNLGRAKARFADDPDGVRAIIDEAHAEAKEALTDLRNLVRGVHPPVLTDRGLDAAVSGLAALCPVPVTVRADLDARPSASVEAIAYFVVGEALTNVAKHARATRADVSLIRHGAVLRVVIRDDGIGGADPRGEGLSGLADRVAAVDGRLWVRSPAGGPTVIEAELPCGS